MAMKCDNCSKGIMYGHNVSHSKRKTNRTFKPNLQYTVVKVNGKQKRVKLCTGCIKLIRKQKAQVAKEVSALPSDNRSQIPKVS